LSNRIFCFCDSIDETLSNYVEIYLPKYLCSFFNPTSNLTKANLYFGINDNRKIIGIPYIGALQSFFTHIRFPEQSVKNNIENYIQIEIIKVYKSKILSNQILEKL
jgi:hypothetical protein